MPAAVSKDALVWLALCALALVSWSSAELRPLVGLLALAKFLGIFWVFMEMGRAHAAWLGLAVTYLGAWLGALLLL